MKNVFFIPGGFQNAQQEYQLKGKVTISFGGCNHANNCIQNEGINGQLFFTGLAWSESQESIVKETIAYTGCSEDEIEIVEQDQYGY